MLDAVYFGLDRALNRLHYEIAPPRLELARLERLLLENVVAALPGDCAAILQRQVEALNLVQRSGDFTRSVFYRIERGAERFPPELRFPLRAHDILFAVVKFSSVSEPEPLLASFRAHEGRFFQMEFSGSVEHLLSKEDVTIGFVKVMPDALIPAP